MVVWLVLLWQNILLPVFLIYLYFICYIYRTGKPDADTTAINNNVNNNTTNQLQSQRYVDVEICGHLKPITGIDWHPNQTTFITCSQDGVINVWSLPEFLPISNTNNIITNSNNTNGNSNDTTTSSNTTTTTVVTKRIKVLLDLNEKRGNS